MVDKLPVPQLVSLLDFWLRSTSLKRERVQVFRVWHSVPWTNATIKKHSENSYLQNKLFFWRSFWKRKQINLWFLKKCKTTQLSHTKPPRNSLTPILATSAAWSNTGGTWNVNPWRSPRKNGKLPPHLDNYNCSYCWWFRNPAPVEIDHPSRVWLIAGYRS